MAAAAYAALLSLMQTIEHVHSQTTLSISFDKKHYEALHTNVNILIKFLESYSSGGGEDLKSQIRDKASQAEYIIEDFVKDHVKGDGLVSRLDQVIEELASIIKETKKFEETKGTIVEDQLPTSTM